MIAEDTTQVVAARFAHELVGPIGSVGHALELLEQQLKTILSKEEWEMWKAGHEATLVPVASGVPKRTERSLLPDRLAKRLKGAIAKNKEIEHITKNMSPDKLDRALKAFEAGFSHKCAQMGADSSLGIIKNLRSWNSAPGGELADDVSITQTLKMAWVMTSSRVNNLDVSWDLETTPTVKANPYSLTQVWMNILLNASQVNKDGSHVRIALKKSDVLQVSFANTGEPLPKKIRLFEKGQTRREGGTGLGLHLCKEIVEAHNGTISARNAEDGKGVIFLVELPYNA